MNWSNYNKINLVFKVFDNNTAKHKLYLNLEVIAMIN